jgi:hypothetical protein
MENFLLSVRFPARKRSAEEFPSSHPPRTWRMGAVVEALLRKKVEVAYVLDVYEEMEPYA